MRSYSNWQWHLDEVFVKINGETDYLWRAVDHEGEMLKSYFTKRRNRKAALKFFTNSMNRYGQPQIFVTDKLRSYGAAMKVNDNAVADSFFQLLKRERIRRRTYLTRDVARQDVFDYIEMFYNPTRKHTNNGMLSPVDYEMK